MKMPKTKKHKNRRMPNKNNYQMLVPRLLKLLKRNSMKKKLLQLPLLRPKKRLPEKPPSVLLSKHRLNLLELKLLKEKCG